MLAIEGRIVLSIGHSARPRRFGARSSAPIPMTEHPSVNDNRDATTRTRVLVVDDQPLIRRGLSLLLAADPAIDVVGQAANGEEAIDLVAKLAPHVVLMDLQMPVLGGVPATRRIVTAHPSVHVVVLTTFDTDDLIFEAIRAGAQAYLLKDARESEVIETIQAVRRGESRLSPQIARKVMEQFRCLPAAPIAAEAPAGVGAPTEAEQDPGPDALTKREQRILAFLAEGKSNREIAAAVFLAEGTVKNHVSRIMEKLHVRSRTALVVKALRGPSSD